LSPGENREIYNKTVVNRRQKEIENEWKGISV
jgi:hypothetical protein